MSKFRVLLYGATGALGSGIASVYTSHGWEVFPMVRKSSSLPNEILMPNEEFPHVFDAVVFAQGANMNGSYSATTHEQVTNIFEANVGFIVDQIKHLMEANAIAKKGKVVILSSLAEIFTRKEKLAYTISKAAVGGLVRSLAVDLGRSHQILVNGILPGVVESPMTAATLDPAQFAHLVESTPVGNLPTPQDIGNSVFLLGSNLNTAISGQSLLVDNAHSITYLP